MSPSKLMSFSCPQTLSDWLRPRLPSDSMERWGISPGTKNLHNLWLEISQGEASLADSTPPVRTVHVASIRILSDSDPAMALLEWHQELSDGSLRHRHRPLSEKMKPGEGIGEAVRRALREELGSAVGDLDRVTVVPGSYKQRVEERDSASYPGLPACYVFHSVDALVHGLPAGDFWTHEEAESQDCRRSHIEEQALFVKKHFWKWMTLGRPPV